MDNEKSSSKLLPTEEEDKRVKASQMCLLNQEQAQENKPPSNNTATPPYPIQGTYVKQDSQSTRSKSSAPTQNSSTPQNKLRERPDKHGMQLLSSMWSIGHHKSQI